MRASVSVLGLFGLVLAGCGPQQVPLDVRFPSTETFLVSRSMRIRVYELGDLSTCPALVTAVTNGRDPEPSPLFESAELTPCDVRAGATIPDVGGGLRSFLVEGLDRTGNDTIVAGCVEGEIFSGGRLEVSVSPTPSYDAAYRSDIPEEGETLDSRCGAAR